MLSVFRIGLVFFFFGGGGYTFLVSCSLHIGGVPFLVGLSTDPPKRNKALARCCVGKLFLVEGKTCRASPNFQWPNHKGVVYPFRDQQFTLVTSSYTPVQRKGRDSSLTEVGSHHLA